MHEIRDRRAGALGLCGVAGLIALAGAALAGPYSPGGAGKDASRRLQEAPATRYGKTLIYPAEKMPRKKEVPSEKSRRGIKESLEHWEKVRAFPLARYDRRREFAAMRHRDQMPTTINRNSGGGGGNRQAPPPAGGTGSTGLPLIPDGARWEFTGPRNVRLLGNKSGLGPAGSFISGRVNHVAYDPRNPRTIYIATGGGGVWRSLDGGANWTPMSDFAFGRIETTWVAVHPTNTRILLVALGDHPTGVGGEGIARSTDQGRTWQIVGGDEMGGSAVSAVEFDPDTPNIALATSTAGVFRSTDSGLTWNPVNLPGGDWTGFSIGARNPATGRRFYYASLRAGGIFRSNDKGATWVQLTDIPLRYLGAPNSGNSGVEVAASKIDPNTVYVSEGSAQALDGRIFRSFNAGDLNSWTDITGQYPSTAEGDAWVQVWYDHHLTTSFSMINGLPRDVLHHGLLSVLGNASQSGAFWTNITVSYSNNPRAHVDQHGMAVNPLNGNQSIIANDGGVYGLTFNPATSGWTVDGSLSKTLGVSQFYGADWHPTNPDVMLGGTQDNSTFVSYGNTHEWRNEVAGDGFSAQIHDVNTALMASTSQGGGFFVTPNASSTGATWFNATPPLDEPAPFDTQIAMEKTQIGSTINFPPPINAPRPVPVVYLGAQSIWRFGVLDTAQTPPTIWQKLGSQKINNGDGDAVVTSIAVWPTQPNVIYAGSSDGAVWFTSNAYLLVFGAWVPNTAANVTWTQINNSPVRSLPLGSVLSISINPRKANDILVGIGGVGTEHLWRLVAQFDPLGNLISGWTPQSGIQGTSSALPDTPITSISRDPFDPESTIYVGTDVGVFASSDIGSTWANIGRNLGLPHTPVNEVEAVGGTGFLNVATFGRGMWRIPLTDVNGFDIGVGAGLRRVGGQIATTLTVTNTASATLTNVRVTSATMRIERNSNVINTSTALPLTISSALGVGDVVNGTLNFNNASLTPGTFVNLTVNIQATMSGLTKTAVRTFRMRIP